MASQAHRAEDPDFEARVRASFAAQGVMKLLGAEISTLAPGHCEIRLPYRPELSQQDGFFHAGVTSTIADSAGGYAGYTLMPAGASVLTVEFKTNLVAPADGELLIARGSVLRPGRTLIFTRVDVDVDKSGQRTLCATYLQTLICRRARS